MGCGVSRLDGNGIVFPAKLRPIFLYRLEEIKARRHARPLKKELLLHDHDIDHRDEDEKSSSSDKNAPSKNMPNEKVNHEEKNGESGKEKRIEEVTKAKDDEAEMDGDDRTDDERMIGHDDDDDDGAFRGSPSFRVYFKDDGEHNGHENNAFGNAISSDEAKSSKESKVVKMGRKKSGKNKGVKNLLNYKSCYNATPSSGHDQANLLTGKTINGSTEK